MSDENDVIETNDEIVDDQESTEEIEGDELESESAEGEGVEAETLDELEDELTEAAKNGATQQELKNMVKEFELKVNGKTIHKKLDLNDTEAIQKELQKAYAGQQAMQQKAELEKALVAQVNDWKKDPSKFLQAMGMDPNEWAEMQIQKQIEEMKKDPLELEREKMQAELQKLREEVKAKEEREKQLEMERLQEKVAMELDEEISTALDAHGSLPSNPRVVKQIADTMLWAMDNGFEDVTAADVIPTVEAEIRKEIADLMGSLPEQVMEDYIGKKNLERLRKQRLSSAKKVPATAKSINKKPSSPPKKESKQEVKIKKSIDDFLRRR